jgi:hypothetical protein
MFGPSLKLYLIGLIPAIPINLIEIIPQSNFTIKQKVETPKHNDHYQFKNDIGSRRL